MGTNVKDRRHNTSDVMISACVAAERALSAEAGKGLQKTPISTETLCPARFAIFKCDALRHCRAANGDVTAGVI
jgi:hypothetical protein